MAAALFDKFLSLFPCRRKQRPLTRTIYVGNAVTNAVEVTVPEVYPSNRVISSKYTAWNFLPKNLFEQFHRIANFYFLVVAIIELLINTPVSPWTSIAPLIFVVTVTAVKQGYEDWLRHKADKEVNYKECLVVRNGQLEKIKAMDMVVGDIVKVTSNGDIPCDIVMLSGEDPEGTCYITTANLDGETNLKTYCAVSETRHLRTEQQLTDLRAKIECQQPITDLYQFIGRIIVSHENDVNVTQSLGPENVILRGSRLKNTQYIYGCAIYTGQETKISLNSKYKSQKYSRVEKKMNTYLIVYLIVLVSYSVIWECITLGFYSYPINLPTGMWYVGGLIDFWTQSSGEQFNIIVQEFLSFMVLCNYIIPISMYVTVELQKFFGSLFFVWDLELYDPIMDEPAKANTSDLNEELGQVQYLFTDKTGTLTENEMLFRQCSVAGVIYEESEGKLCVRQDHPLPDVLPTPIHQLTPEILELLIALALCHTVRVDKKDGGGVQRSNNVRSETGANYEYQSSSPDEKALVEACQRFGVVYHGLRHGCMELTINGRLRQYLLHHTLEFDSSRKCMSVIVQSVDDGSYELVCKGAETAIFERCHGSGGVETVERHVNDFAVLGFRTLVIAKRSLTAKEFAACDNLIREAKMSLEDRGAKLAEAYASIEKDLQLLGATAVEDKLQDGVAETISALRSAGIQVWVLTGDKEETAVNISYAAGHLSYDMEPLSLTRQANAEECGATLDTFVKLLEDRQQRNQKPKHALIVDGKSLTFALDCHQDLLRNVCLRCVTVLCCRMSPMQKALVVRMMKSGKYCPTTAAIGDGANDVSMIQEAHVGLGLMGKEGRQAVRSSDYAFARFRFLKRALLGHGHYFYLRMAILVQYFFYKNVAMITAELYFTFFSAFSAQSVYNGFFLMWFNLTFTALPILLYGWFELHVDMDVLMKRPELYRTIRNNRLLATSNFLKWNILGLWHSLVLFFGPYFALAPGNSPFENGWQYGVYDFGLVVMTSCVITVTIKLMLESYCFNWIIIGGYVISIGGYFLMTGVYCVMLWPVLEDTMQMYGSMQTMLNSGYIWLLMLMVSVVALLPDILLRSIQDSYSPVHSPHADSQLTDVLPGRSDSLADLLSNAAYTDRSNPGVHDANGDVSTVTVSYNRLRQRVTISSGRQPVTPWPPKDTTSNGRTGIELPVINGYSSSPSSWLRQEESLYRAGTSNPAFIDISDNSVPTQNAAGTVGNVAGAGYAHKDDDQIWTCSEV